MKDACFISFLFSLSRFFFTRVGDEVRCWYMWGLLRYCLFFKIPGTSNRNPPEWSKF